MDLDLVGFQELALQDSFDQLLAALPGYEGILSHVQEVRPDGFYLVRGLVFRKKALTLIEQVELLPDNPLFDHGVLFARLAYDDGEGPTEIAVAVVHLKAGQTDADHATRTAQMNLVEAEVRALVDGGETKIIVLGDFNQDPSEPQGPGVWQPFLDPAAYALPTHALVTFDATHSGGRFLDHIVLTSALADALGSSVPRVIHLERAASGYARDLSDHLPVALSLLLKN